MVEIGYRFLEKIFGSDAIRDSRNNCEQKWWRNHRKKIRQVHGVQPSDRSAINFYARTLIYLKDNGVLKSVENNPRSPHKYALRNREKLISLVKTENGNIKYINKNASD